METKNKKSDLVKWDCKFYKSDTECFALRKMTCRKKKECKFYKRIDFENDKN